MLCATGLHSAFARLKRCIFDKAGLQSAINELLGKNLPIRALMRGGFLHFMPELYSGGTSAVDKNVCRIDLRDELTRSLLVFLPVS